MNPNENTAASASGIELAKPLLLNGLATGVGLAFTGAAVSLSIVGLGLELPKTLFTGLAARAGRSDRGAHARKLLGHGGRRMLPR